MNIKQSMNSFKKRFKKRFQNDRSECGRDVRKMMLGWLIQNLGNLMNQLVVISRYGNVGLCNSKILITERFSVHLHRSVRVSSSFNWRLRALQQTEQVLRTGLYSPLAPLPALPPRGASLFAPFPIPVSCILTIVFDSHQYDAIGAQARTFNPQDCLAKQQQRYHTINQNRHHVGLTNAYTALTQSLPRTLHDAHLYFKDYTAADYTPWKFTPHPCYHDLFEHIKDILIPIAITLSLYSLMKK